MKTAYVLAICTLGLAACLPERPPCLDIGERTGVNGRCECPKGFVASASHRKCEPVKEIDDAGDGAGAAGHQNADAQTDGPTLEESDTCGGRCTGGQPVCNPAGQCVACSATDRGACAAGEQCDVLASACVACLKHTDCTNPAASVCDSTTHQCKPCAETSTSDCDHIAGKNVCSAGECVQCTAHERDACMTESGSPAVCDYDTHACTRFAVAGTNVCGGCRSDAQCLTNQRCVRMTLPRTTQEVGFFASGL
jgi:hypothetical protein